MAVSARGKGFQAKFMLAGDRHVAQFNSRVEAEAWEAACRLAHAKGQPLPEAHAGTARAGRVIDLESLLRDCENMRWKTRKSGEHLAMIARLFVEWVGPRRPVQDALTPANVDAYVRWREQEKRNSSATINRHLSAISVLVKHAHRLDLIDRTFELPWQREGQGRLRYFEEHEVEAILATMESWGLHQYVALFTFLVDTGARLGEAEKLQWQDIRGKSITFEDTKNGLTRTVTATPRVLALLTSINKTRKGPFEGLNRDHLRRTWDRLRTHLNLGDDCVVHTFRHTCASRLVQRGVDLYRVKTWMGHKDISTTMRYSHLGPKHLEELADVLSA
jgi:integrase